MKISNSEFLKKLIEIQSCIIRGRDVKALMYKNSHLYLEHSRANIITICMNDLKSVHIEHIFEKERKFEHFLKIKSCILSQKNSTCQSLISNYEHCFINNKYYWIKNEAKNTKPSK